MFLPVSIKATTMASTTVTQATTDMETNAKHSTNATKQVGDIERHVEGIEVNQIVVKSEPCLSVYLGVNRGKKQAAERASG